MPAVVTTEAASAAAAAADAFWLLQYIIQRMNAAKMTFLTQMGGWTATRSSQLAASLNAACDSAKRVFTQQLYWSY